MSDMKPLVHDNPQYEWVVTFYCNKNGNDGWIAFRSQGEALDWMNDNASKAYRFSLAKRVHLDVTTVTVTKIYAV